MNSKVVLYRTEPTEMLEKTLVGTQGEKFILTKNIESMHLELSKTLQGYVKLSMRP